MLDTFFILLSVLIGSFYLLIKSSDYLISSASSLGEKIGISPFVIGLTLVSVGTSLPELFTALFGITLSDGPSFVIGTVIGSNISNILLVFGFLLIVSSSFKLKILEKDKIFLLVSAMLFIFVMFMNVVSLFFSLLFLLGFIAYMYVCVRSSSKQDYIDVTKEAEEDLAQTKSTAFVVLVFISSLVALNLAARGVVYGIEEIGLLFSIPLEYLTLTTVAFATSLPELAVVYSAAKKKTQSLAVGNIIGSNISNIFLIIGFSGLYGIIIGKPIVFDVMTFFNSLLFFIFSTLLFIALLYRRSYPKYIGYLMIAIYLLYVVLIF